MKWQPTPVFLPGKSHGQRNLVGYSPKVRRVSHNWATEHKTLSSQISAYFFYSCCPTFVLTYSPSAVLTSFHFLSLLSLWTGCSLCLNVPFPHCLPGFLLIQPLTQRHLPYPSSLDPHLSPSHHATDDHFVIQDCASPVHNCHWVCLILFSF